MKEEKQKKDEEYVEVSLMEYIKYSKPFHIVCLVVVLCLMTSGILYQQIEIMNLQSDLKEVADNANYDLDRHAKTETTDEIELKAETLMSTDWFKKNTIKKPTSKKNMFSSKKSEYYVYLYKDDCIFCKQTEAHMFEKLETMKKKRIIISTNCKFDAPTYLLILKILISLHICSIMDHLHDCLILRQTR